MGVAVGGLEHGVWAFTPDSMASLLIVPLKQLEYGFGYITIRSPYTYFIFYLLKGDYNLEGRITQSLSFRDSGLGFRSSRTYMSYSQNS